MFNPKTVSKLLLEFRGFPIKNLGNRAISKKHMKLEDMFYFVGNYKQRTFSSHFFFQFIFTSLFSDARNDCTREGRRWRERGFHNAKLI